MRSNDPFTAVAVVDDTDDEHWIYQNWIRFLMKWLLEILLGVRAKNAKHLGSWFEFEI